MLVCNLGVIDKSASKYVSLKNSSSIRVSWMMNNHCLAYFQCVGQTNSCIRTRSQRSQRSQRKRRQGLCLKTQWAIVEKTKTQVVHSGRNQCLGFSSVAKINAWWPKSMLDRSSLAEPVKPCQLWCPMATRVTSRPMMTIGAMKITPQGSMAWLLYFLLSLRFNKNFIDKK